MPLPSISIDIRDPIATISPNLYGHFIEHLGACINNGVWVGESSPIPNIAGIRSDVVAALRKIKPPVLRWPGGCFADDYHWQDGIGPRDRRPRTVNLWWGQEVETNAFGTHEFLRLCDAIGAQPYLAGNVGSGSVREMRDWVEYCNYPGDSTLARQRAANGSPDPFAVKLWGVGNEAWGCGGHFCPEDYAAEYKRFATYLPDFANTPLFLIACGPDGNNPAWTQRFFTKLGNFPRIHGFAAHYYAGTAGTSTTYTPDQWYELLHRALLMENLIRQHRSLMDGFDPHRRIALIVDEWGTWHPPTPQTTCLFQQNTLRDALVAAATLNIFNRCADLVSMANIAQTLNVLHSLLLTRENQLVLTPTYHIFDMYQHHQAAQALRTFVETPHITFRTPDGRTPSLPRLQASASLKQDVLTLTVVHAQHDLPLEATITLRGDPHLRDLTLTELSHDDIHAHNTFDSPDTLKPQTRTLPIGSSTWRHTFPPASVTLLRARLA
jgi:alpha-N-arabinofuranosidase